MDSSLSGARLRQLSLKLSLWFELSVKLCLAANGTAPSSVPGYAERFADAVQDEAESYSAEPRVVVPRTLRTMKSAGTTGKLFGLTEAAHLQSMRKLTRRVQFRSDDLVGE